MGYEQHFPSPYIKQYITKITKQSTSPQEISNAMRRLIIQNSIFVKLCDQIVSSFWSHDFMFLSFRIFEFRYININIAAMEGLRCGKFENYQNNILLQHLHLQVILCLQSEIINLQQSFNFSGFYDCCFANKFVLRIRN